MIVSVKDETLKILYDGWDNKVSIHRDKLAPKSKGYSNESNGEKEGSTEKARCFEEDVEEVHETIDDLNVVDKIVRHVHLGPRLKYVVQWYGYSKADDTAKLSDHVP